MGLIKVTVGSSDCLQLLGLQQVWNSRPRAGRSLQKKHIDCASPTGRHPILLTTQLKQ